MYRDLALMLDWLSGTLGFVEKARAVNAAGVVTHAELAVGATTLLLERGDLQPDAYPRGTRWTGVWVDDPDAWFHRLRAMGVDVSSPENEPWVYAS